MNAVTYRRALFWSSAMGIDFVFAGSVVGSSLLLMVVAWLLRRCVMLCAGCVLWRVGWSWLVLVVGSLFL